jgi:hypothetical protein
LRGCDEAWYLQSAIDAELGKRQEYRVRGGSGDLVILDFFSPLPSWARRRLDAIGNPSTAERSLFSYSLHRRELPEESRFLQEWLWMKESIA